MRQRTDYRRGILLVGLVLLVAAALPVVRAGAVTPPAIVVSVEDAGDGLHVALRLDGVDGVTAYEVELSSDGAPFEAPSVPAGRSHAIDELDDRVVLAAVGVPAGDGGLDLGSVRALGEATVSVTAARFVDDEGRVVAHLPAPVELESGSTALRVSLGDDAPVVAATVTSPEDHDPSEVVIDWQLAHLAGEQCGTGSPADLTGDGCVDIADLVAAPSAPQFSRSTAAGPAGQVFTVDSTGDDWDANAGNGVCATATGTCTLRAAMHESKSFPGIDTIEFAIPGPGPHTISIGQALPRLTEGGTLIDGYSQPGATPNTDPLASNAQLMIEIDGGFDSSFDAITIFSPGNEVRGLSVHGVRRPIWVIGDDSNGNLIRGNFIGVDPAGGGGWPTLELAAHGIHVELDAPATVIGGPAPAHRNVISGNGRHGIGFWHNKTDGFVVQGNIIGLDPTGSVAVPNRKHGVDVNFGASGGLIGGSAPGQANVISGNIDTGVELSHTTGTTANEIRGNHIGTSLDGQTAPTHAANLNYGIAIEDGASANVIDGNTVVNNAVGGIVVRNGGDNGNSGANTFTGNLVGELPDGTPAANGGAGVTLAASQTVFGPGNVVAGNGGAGVEVTELDAIDNTITENEIRGNAGLGIDLAPIGSTNANDVGDADSGANTLLNHPEWTRSTSQVFEGTACASCVVEIFTADGSSAAGSGASLVTSTTTDATGAFSVANPSVPIDEVVTATATDPAGNTSEFSTNATVVFHNDPPVLSIVDPAPVPEGGSVLLDATGSDPDGDELVYAWDLDGDGSFETPGQQVTFSAADLDGPTTAEVAVRGTDPHGATGSNEATVTITNVVPTAGLDVAASAQEGATVPVTVVDGADASPADASALRYAVACDGSSLDGVTYAVAASSPSFGCAFPDGPDTATVRARVLDDDGGFSEYLATVDVINVAPTVTVALTGTSFTEGSPIDFEATVTDPSAADEAAGLATTWRATLDGIEFDSGSPTTGAVTPVDGGVLEVDFDATDDDGGVGIGAASVTIAGVAPTASVASSTSGDTSTVTVIDADDASAADLAAGLRYAFDCDGGPLDATAYAAASTSPTTDCTYSDGLGTHTVTVLVIDKDDDSTEYTVSVGDGNQPPSVSVPPSFAVDEGASVGLGATGNDPEQGPLTYEWDLDDDGTFEVTGQSPSFDAAVIDGPASLPVSVRVTDAGGLTATASTTVSVANVAPTGTIDAPPAFEASPVTVTVTAADIAPDDAAALRYAFDCAGGSLDGVTYETASSIDSVDCTFDDGPATPLVRARVLDDDGGAVDLEVNVAVANVAPTITVETSPTTADEGDTASFSFVVGDVSAADESAGLGVSWSAILDGVEIATGSGTTGSFVIPDDGPLTVSATVSDKDGDTGGDSFAVTVANVDPTADLVVPPTGVEGDTIDVSFANAIDAGSGDVADLRYAVSCDGSSLDGVTHAVAQPTATLSCQLPDDGELTVAGVVLDDDGGRHELSAPITVSGVAPTARVRVPTTAVVGADVGIVVDDVDDASPADVSAGFEFAFDCGAGFGAFTSAATATCAPSSTPGVRTLAVTVRDADLAERTYQASLVTLADRVVNPTFDLDADADGVPDGWSNSSSLALVTAGARSGSAIEQTSAGQESSFFKSSVFDVLGGSRHVVSAWVDSPTGGVRELKMRIRWFRADGSTIRASLIALVDGPTTGYEQISSEVVAPSDAASAWIEFATTTTSSTVRIDDASVLVGNQLINGDFEIDDDGTPGYWTAISRLATETLVVHDGAASAALLADGTASFALRQGVVPVAPGGAYRGSVWVNVPEGVVDPLIRIEVRWLDAANQAIGVELLDKVDAVTPGWVHFAGTEIAPAGAVDARLEIRVKRSVGTMYVDDAYFGPA